MQGVSEQRRGQGTLGPCREEFNRRARSVEGGKHGMDEATVGGSG